MLESLWSFIYAAFDAQWRLEISDFLLEKVE